MERTSSRPIAARADREERRQALLLAAQRHLNPETGRLPADQVKGIYAELAREFGLEPSSVATYLPSTLKPTSAETLAYARSQRSAKAAQRREELVVAKAPVAAPPEPSAAAPEALPPVARVSRAGGLPADLAQALEAFAAALTAGKEQEMAQLRGQIAALEADNQRLMAEVYRLERRLQQVQAVLGNGDSPVRPAPPRRIREEGSSTGDGR
jgi:hypothetical protein